jgi:hypothetical protein
MNARLPTLVLAFGSAAHAKTAGLLRVAIRAALTSADEYHSAIGCLDLPHAG